MDRRKFLKRAGLAALGTAVVGGVYPFLEAKWCRVARRTIAVPNLPAPFRGTTVALLADVHHGPYVPLAYIRHVVEMTNSLRPDIVLLAGDYVHQSCRLHRAGDRRAGQAGGPHGPVRRPGQPRQPRVHAHHPGRAGRGEAPRPEQHRRLARAPRRPAADRRRRRSLDRRQDLDAALGDATPDDATILLSHNPDFVESIRDPRVGLVLSGHTHGGQVVVPGFGAPIVPSRYGQKYLHGLVQGPCTQVFVTRGVGTITPPVRFLCRPEVVLITLV